MACVKEIRDRILGKIQIMSNYHSNHPSLQNVQGNKFRVNSLCAQCYEKDFPRCESTPYCLLCPVLFWPFSVKSAHGALKSNTLVCRFFKFIYLIATRPIGCNGTKTLSLLSLSLAWIDHKIRLILGNWHGGRIPFMCRSQGNICFIM